MARTITELFTVKTAVGFFNQWLDVAASVGLITTTWRVGDPTLTQATALSRMLAAGEQSRMEFAKAGFLADAEGDWLKLRALDVYGVLAGEKLPATSTLFLTNGGGGFYNRLAGSAVFKSTLSGKTYRSTSSFTLNGFGSTATVSVIAEEAGSDSSAGPNEIDSIVTTMLGVTVTSSTAAVGVDEQSDPSIREQCLATLGALSPDGPADAYEYVARNPALTLAAEVTRAAAFGDSADGAVDVWVATASGVVSGPSVALVQTAIERWATPLCITPTVLSASVVTVNVTASIHGTSLPGNAAALIAAALAELFAGLAIAKDPAGYDLDPTTITTAIRNAVPQITAMPAYAPASAVHIAQGSVPVLGTVGITVV
jgi:hypothetical protein